MFFSVRVYNAEGLNGKRSQLRDGLPGNLKECRIGFHAYAAVADSDRSRNGRTCSHKRIEHYANSERQRSPHYLPHEGLWLQRRMGCNPPFIGPCGGRGNDVAERGFG